MVLANVKGEGGGLKRLFFVSTFSLVLFSYLCNISNCRVLEKDLKLKTADNCRFLRNLKSYRQSLV